MEDDNYTIFDVLKSLENTDWEQFAKSVSAALTAFTNFLDGFNKVYTEILPNLSRALEQFAHVLDVPGYTEEEKRELVSSYIQWGEYGWCFFPSLPGDIFLHTSESQEIADELISAYDQEKEISLILEELKSTDVSSDDLSEAYFCYSHERYKACSMVLFSILDRMLIQEGFCWEKGESKKREGTLKTGEAAIKAFEKAKSDEIKEKAFIFYLLFANVISCIKEFFKDGDNFQLDTPFVNRNLLDHGMEKRPVTSTDCFRIFCAIYSFSQIKKMSEELGI